MIDIEQLNARLGHNEVVVNKILSVFCKQYGNSGSLFSDAMSCENTQEIYHLAHSLKGALMTLCAKDDAAIAAKIEMAARDNDLPEDYLIKDVEQRVTAINAQINGYLDSNK